MQGLANKTFEVDLFMTSNVFGEIAFLSESLHTIKGWTLEGLVARVDPEVIK